VAEPRSEEARKEGEGLPRRSRIHQTGEIRALLQSGARQRSHTLDLFSAPAPGGSPRFGAIVPKHGREIVERNLLRRRLREVGRRSILPGLRDRGCLLDVLVRARPQAYAASFEELQAELIRLTERLCSDASFSR